jgi:hypothetical protein
MIGSPEPAMKRLCEGLLNFARMAAQLAGAERPTEVTKPTCAMAMSGDLIWR